MEHAKETVYKFIRHTAKLPTQAEWLIGQKVISNRRLTWVLVQFDKVRKACRSSQADRNSAIMAQNKLREAVATHILKTTDETEVPEQVPMAIRTPPSSPVHSDGSDSSDSETETEDIQTPIIFTATVVPTQIVMDDNQEFTEVFDPNGLWN